MSINFSGSKINMHVYTDSDWDSKMKTRSSTSGYVVRMTGGPVNLISKLRPIVTVSSMEACFFAIQVVAWIHQLLRENRPPGDFCFSSLTEYLISLANNHAGQVKHYYTTYIENLLMLHPLLQTTNQTTVTYT